MYYCMYIRTAATHEREGQSRPNVQSSVNIYCAVDKGTIFLIIVRTEKQRGGVARSVDAGCHLGVRRTLVLRIVAKKETAAS